MRYLLTTLLALVVMLAAIAGFNWWVDPYGYFLHWPFGLYESGTFRSIKARTITAYAPEGLLLGSSTTQGIDPSFITACRFYNAGFSGASSREILYFAETKAPPVKVALLGLDLAFMNASIPEPLDERSFGFDWKQASSYLLSTPALHQSWWTLKMWKRKRMPALSANGFYRWAEEAWKAETPDTPFDHAKALAASRVTVFQNWRYDPERVENYRKTAEILRSKGARVLVYINPMAQALLDQLGDMGALADLDHFRRDVLTAFPDAVDFSTELTARELYFRNDPLHYTPGTGQMIVGRVLERQGLCGF